jgi:hypothetical protein
MSRWVLVIATWLLAAIAFAAPPQPAWFRPERVDLSARGLRYLVAVAAHPLSPEERAELAAAGAEILDYVPGRGYRLRLPAAGESTVRRLPFLRAVVPVDARLKVDEQLASTVGANATAPLRVVLAPGEPAARVARILAPYAAVSTPSGKDGAWRVVAGVPAATLAEVLSALASLPEVEGVEAVRPVRPLNQDAVWVHQSFVGPSPQQTPVFDRGIFGCGQIVAVADTAQDYDLCYFRDATNGPAPVSICTGAPCPVASPALTRRKDILYYNWSAGPTGEEDTCPASITGSSGHGTHVTGSVAGDTAPYADCTAFASPGRNGGDGQAPGAKLVVQELGDGLEYLNDLGGTMWNLADVAFQSGARIHSNSWGGACYDAFGSCIPGCTMPYDSYARDADLAMWSHPDLLVVVAAGNGGAYCAAPAAIGTPANAKNALVVGSVGHGSQASTPSWFTSPGPVHDGRLGPAVAAQGESTVSAASDANLATNNCGSCSLDGSSMSAPTVAGLAALVREYFTAGFYATGSRNPGQGVTPSGALIKAALIDAAVPLGANAPGADFESGFGRIQLDRTLAFAGSGFKLRVDDRREGLVTGGVVTHAYDVAAGTPFRATLTWTDYPGALYTNVARVNELKLEVIDPGGSTWFQTLDGATGLPVATANASDAHDGRNVEERLVFDTPAPGRWVVRVRGIDVPWGPQPFALVVRGALTDCPAPPAPAAPTPTTPADHQVQLTWPAVSGASTYNVYRSLGGCPGSSWLPIATAISGSALLDTGVSGGATYGYAVAAASDPGAACESPRSACASIVPSGDCVLAPSFQGARSAGSAGAAACGVTVSWTAAIPYCGPDVRYNVYRGATGAFVPGPSNRIARCLLGSSLTDSVSLIDGATYWYVVRAEDATTGHGGPCRGGNEDGNSVAVAASPKGPDSIGAWTDDAGDTGLAKMVPAAPWTTAATGGHAAASVYEAASFAGACADLTTPAITLADPGQGPQLTFWTKHDLEYDPSGEILGKEGSLGQAEIATGPSFAAWTRIPLSPDYPELIEFPYNLCGSTQSVGNYFTGIHPTYAMYTASLANWAGGDVKVRFHLSGDFLYPGGAWWVDDLAVTKALVPGSCQTAAAGPPPVPDGAYVPGAPMRASRSGTSVALTWDTSQCTAAAVNVYRGALGTFSSFTGGFCGLAPTGSATIAMPDNAWFLVAATDGVSQDGSYGRTATGGEMIYGGAALACPGTTTHLTNNACP